VLFIVGALVLGILGQRGPGSVIGGRTQPGAPASAPLTPPAKPITPLPAPAQPAPAQPAPAPAR
jgi:hypothetical protein